MVSIRGEARDLSLAVLSRLSMIFLKRLFICTSDPRDMSTFPRLATLSLRCTMLDSTELFSTHLTILALTPDGPRIWIVSILALLLECPHPVATITGGKLRRHRFLMGLVQKNVRGVRI